MGGIIERMRKQKAWYWAPSDNALDAFGQPVPKTSPILISCRWQDDQVAYVGTDGTTKISRSIIFPDRVLRLGGYAMLVGTLVRPKLTPEELPDAFELKAIRAIPTLSAKQTLHKAFM